MQEEGFSSLFSALFWALFSEKSAFEPSKALSQQISQITFDKGAERDYFG